MLFEFPDALYQFSRLLKDPVFRGEDIPHGHGEPVLVIPGFMGHDGFYATLRSWLRRIGYSPYSSGILFANAHLETSMKWLRDWTKTIRKRTGVPPSIAGHSMGGSQALMLAAELEGVVYNAIALGSPATPNPESANELVERLFYLVQRFYGTSREDVDLLVSEMAKKFNPLPRHVRAASISSVDDPIVHHADSNLPEGTGTNYKVTGSHIGLIFNPDVYRAIAMELAR